MDQTPNLKDTFPWEPQSTSGAINHLPQLYQVVTTVRLFSYRPNIHKWWTGWKPMARRPRTDPLLWRRRVPSKCWWCADTYDVRTVHTSTSYTYISKLPSLLLATFSQTLSGLSFLGPSWNCTSKRPRQARERKSKCAKLQVKKSSNVCYWRGLGDHVLSFGMWWLGWRCSSTRIINMWLTRG